MALIRVALNATPLLFPLTGVGRYTAMLARELLAADGVECDFFYGYRWDKSLREAPAPTLAAAAPLLRRLRSLFTPRAVADYLRQRRFDAGRPPHDVYHEPNYFPFRSPAPTVSTFHDLSPLRYPETHTRESRAAWQRNLTRALERSRLILTDSEFVRGEIVSQLGVPPERVRAIHLGVSAAYRPQPAETIAATLAPLGLTARGYALSVGTLEPRKNLLLALDAWRDLPEALGKRYPLMIAGMRGWLSEDIERRLAALEPSGRVRFLGHVDDARLAHLYAGARLFVYPSLYEGFGLPPLEAMACGTPVIVSNRASLPEVVGEAGIQVDAGDAGALALAVRRLAEDDAAWESHRALGLARAARFTWRRCAELTLDAYRAALA